MIVIALGANLPSIFGPPRETIRHAIAEINKAGIGVLYQSPIYLTAPVPISDQPWYHNAVIGIATDLAPNDLLGVLKNIENNLGRVRTVRNAPRVIDLDIITYHNIVQNKDDLILPHPRMDERAFVLYPLRDIAKNWIHPVTKRHINDLIADIPPDQMIQKENRPLIMGILNATPDSFSDGGQFDGTDKAIAHGLQLIAEGADILDIGGESTRPNATIIPPEEEQQRILPIIEGLRNAGALISVDTRNASTMQMALNAGAGMINDISALTHDAESLDTIKDSACRICLMHMQGTPQTMQISPHYNDVVKDVYDYLFRRIDACLSEGIAKDRLMIDVGIGFAKTLDHNVALLQHIDTFKNLGVDILLGTSRKSFIEKICERDFPPLQRLPGSLASLIPAVQSSLQIVRVHDVAETRQFLDVAQKICV